MQDSPEINDLHAQMSRLEKSLALPTQKGSNETPAFLQLTQERLRKMSAEELHEGAILLQQEAYWLQRYQNRCQVVVSWCEDKLERAIAPQLNQARGGSREERRSWAIGQSERASLLSAWQERYRLVVLQLGFLSNRLLELSSRLADYARQKGKRHE